MLFKTQNLCFLRCWKSCVHCMDLVKKYNGNNGVLRLMLYGKNYFLQAVDSHNDVKAKNKQKNKHILN